MARNEQGEKQSHATRKQYRQFPPRLRTLQSFAPSPKRKSMLPSNYSHFEIRIVLVPPRQSRRMPLPIPRELHHPLLRQAHSLGGLRPHPRKIPLRLMKAPFGVGKEERLPSFDPYGDAGEAERGRGA